MDGVRICFEMAIEEALQQKADARRSAIGVKIADRGIAHAIGQSFVNPYIGERATVGHWLWLLLFGQDGIKVGDGIVVFGKHLGVALDACPGFPDKGVHTMMVAKELIPFVD